MSEQQKPEDFNDLVEAATQSVHRQQEQAAARAARPAPQPRSKQVFCALLVAAMAGLFIHQYPRIAQPYLLPDADTDSTVVAAELEVVAELIDGYRLSQGKLPESLDKVRLPTGLAAVVGSTTLAYEIKGEAYVLDWRLPHWHAVLDGTTGQVEVTADAAAR